MVKLQEVIEGGLKSYWKSTPQDLQLLDVFILYSFLSGVLQFLYLMIVGQFPFNSFVSGFISCVGQFVLTVNLRLQLTNPSDFHNISKQRAYLDYVVTNLILFFVVVTFIG
jgi:oligosaccharyltransferase complex subunit epsilon